MASFGLASGKPLQHPTGTLPGTTFRPQEMSVIQTMLAAQIPTLEARRGQAPFSRRLQLAAADPDTGPHDASGSNLWPVGQD